MMVDHARLWRRGGSSKRHLARSRHGGEVLRKTGFPSQLAIGGLRCCCALFNVTASAAGAEMAQGLRLIRRLPHTGGSRLFSPNTLNKLRLNMAVVRGWSLSVYACI